MDFLVKVAETGVAFIYANNPLNEKISDLQTKIQSDTKIEIKDQVLITNDGYRLESSDKLARLESDNLFQMSIHSNENLFKPVCDLYVFDQRKFSDKNPPNDKHAPDFLDSDENLQDYLLEAKIIDRDYPTDFQSQPGVSNLLENITKAHPGILEVESKLFVHLTTVKNKFLEYKRGSKKLQRLIDESQNQIQSFDVLLKHASLLFKQCTNQKNAVLKYFTQVHEKNLAILKKFEEGLENLKKIDLHETLQSKNKKTLMDVYYSENDMYKWRNSCLKLENDIKTGIEESASLIETIQKRLVDEKERSTETVTKHMHNVNLDPVPQEGEAVLLALVLQIYRDYRALREALEKFPENDETCVLADPKWENIDEKAWKEDIAVFNQNIEKIEKALDQISKMKMDFEMPIIFAYDSIMRYAGELSSISNEKMRQLTDEIEKMEKEFCYLLNPVQFVSAYWASLAEVSRRKEFASVFDLKYKELNEIVNTEREKRKMFLSKYGKIIPVDFLPQLKNMPPLPYAENLDVDSTLPNITNILNVETEPTEEIRTLMSKSERPDIPKPKEDKGLRNLKEKSQRLLKNIQNYIGPKSS